MDIDIIARGMAGAAKESGVVTKEKVTEALGYTPTYVDDESNGSSESTYSSEKIIEKISESELSSDVSGLKSDLDDLGLIVVKNCVTEIITGHYFDNSGNLNENSGYDAVIAEVEGGKTYSVNKVIGGNNFNIITDKDGNVIERFTSDKITQIGNGYYFVAPAGSKYIKLSRGINTYWKNFIVLEGICDISSYDIKDYPINTIIALKSQYDLMLKDGSLIESHDKNDKTYYCGSSRDYTTLKSAIEEATKYFDSVVYVDDGTYDLVSEFGTSYLDSYNGTDNIGLFLKNRVHVIFSSGAKVVFDYQGTNEKVHQYFSPFNSGKHGFTLENAYVDSKNCRYSVHDERAHDIDSYHNIYKRCRFIHDSSQASGWHSAQAIGGGLGKYGDILIEDCYYKSISNDDTISYHSTTISEDGNNAKSKIVIRNTYTSGTVDFFQLGNSSEKTEVYVNGCNLRIEPKLEGSVNTMELTSWGNTIRSPQG